MVNILFVSGRDITKYGFIGRPHYFLSYLSRSNNIIILNNPQYWKRKFRKSSNEYKKYLKNVLVVNGYPIKIYDAFLNEAVNLLPNILILIHIVLKYDINLIINYGNIVLGLFSKFWRIKVPIVFEFVDYYPGLIRNTARSKLPVVGSIVRSMATSLAKVAMDISIENSTLVTCTSYLLKYYAKHVGSKRVKLISNGVSVPDFKNLKGSLVRNLHGFSKNDVVVGYVGHIHAHVRLDLLIRAISILRKKGREIKALFVGDGSYLEQFKEESRKHGLDQQIIFTGRVPKEHVFDYIDAMDICTIPFVDGPLMNMIRPLKLFEYLICRKPVISTSLSEIRMMFPNHKYSFIVYADSPETFVTKIEKILPKLKESRFQESLKKISETIKSKFCWHRLAEEFFRYLSITSIDR